MNMEVLVQSIPEVLIIQPTVHLDDRGYFSETFRHDFLKAQLGYEINFIQDNEARSGN